MPSRSRRSGRPSPRRDPTLILVAGDHALNGPEPAGAIDALRDLQAAGALIVQGNTDVAVADFDYSGCVPVESDGVPDADPRRAEWAHEALGEERLEWLRGLPSERRARSRRR